MTIVINWNLTKTVLFLLVICCTLQETACQVCIQSSSCSCYGPGFEISLSSLDSPTESQPKFDNVVSPLTPNVTYAYNPCSSFTKGKDTTPGSCSQPAGVAVCLMNGSEYQSLGTQTSASFNHNLSTNREEIIYKDANSNRQTVLTLECTESDAKNSVLTLKSVSLGSDNQTTYYMTLSSLCACPNGCGNYSDDDGLSFGSLLVILFFTFIFVYFFCGVLFLHYVQGAQGWEIVPHYEFWLELPSLIRDGIVFALNGCKTNSIYSRI